MATLSNRPRNIWQTAFVRSGSLFMELVQPRYTVKAIEESYQTHLALCTPLATNALVMHGQLLLPLPGRQPKPNADTIGHMKAIADILFLRSQEHNDSRLVSIGFTLQEYVYAVCRKIFGDEHIYTGSTVKLLCSWDTSSVNLRSLLRQKSKEASHSLILGTAPESPWYYRQYNSEGNALEATAGLLFVCLRNGEFWNEDLLKGYHRADTWGVHQLRIYIGRKQWDDAEKFGEILLINEAVKSLRWKRLAVLGLLAEAKISQGKALEGEQLFEKVVKEGVTDGGLPLLHPLLCADRLVDIYLAQKKLVKAQGLVQRLIQFKERMQLSSFMPIGWSPPRGMSFMSFVLYPSSSSRLHQPKFSKAVWDAAFAALSQTKQAEGVPEYQNPKKLVIAVLLSLFDNRHKLARLYLRQGHDEAARPIFKTLLNARLHPENQTMIACRDDLEDQVRLCVDSSDWRNAEWLQELVIEAKDRLYSFRYWEDLEVEDKEMVAKRWEPSEMHEPLQLLSRIYRENGSWEKLCSVDFRLLRHRGDHD